MARDSMEPIAIIRKQLEEAEPDLLRETQVDSVTLGERRRQSSNVFRVRSSAWCRG